MLKFYYSGAPNPMKVALFLEEAGLPYEAIPVDTRKGDQHTPDYVAINPNSKVPAIVDGDAVVFDSSAILLYLAEKTQKFLPANTPEARGELLSWMMFVGTGVGPYTDLRAIYALETLHLAEYPATVRVKLQAIRIGELGIVTTPCETFVETGLAIKRESPLPMTFTVELANGYNGYLPPPRHHALGGYETWQAKSSYLEVDAEPKIREALLKLLGQLSMN